MAQLKDTKIDGKLELTGKAYLPNTQGIYTADTDGNYRQNYQGLNGNNNCVIGYGNYTADNGNTHIYGVAVKSITKDNDVTVDGIQIAHTDVSTITSLSSGWEDYGTGTSPVVRRYGKVVSLTGALKNTAAVTLNTSHVKVFTIPSGYRPSQDILILCQGSGNNEYVMQIKTDGGVYFGRYGTSSNVQANAGSWFPFHACWVME